MRKRARGLFVFSLRFIVFHRASQKQCFANGLGVVEVLVAFKYRAELLTHNLSTVFTLYLSAEFDYVGRIIVGTNWNGKGVVY